MQASHCLQNNKLLCLALLTGFAAASLPTLAAEPLYMKNLSPVSGLLGLPSQRGAQVQDKGSLALALQGSVASHYRLDATAEEFLNIDGETRRVALELRYGLFEHWDLQLEVPWLDHDGGNLDRLIDDWHDLWNMPDGGRADVARDLFDYRYANLDGAGFSLLDSASGLGDISLSLNYAFYRDEDATASALLGYKFGSGDEDKFLGSGADDVFAGVRFSGADLAGLPLRWHGQLGYLRAGSSDLLQGIQERNLWFAGVALDWVVHERWSLLAQLDSHAAPTESRITALGDDAVMFTLGARWRFAERWSVDVSVMEDIRVETAPDITFHASLRYSGQ
jgi:Protein of unknown function (DUF3187)